MRRQEYIDEIKLELTSGGVTNLELTDEQIGMFVDKTIREVGRYYDMTKIITVPYARCLDMKGMGVDTIRGIMRADGYIESPSMENSGVPDPMYIMAYQTIAGIGSMYNVEDYLMNYAAWNVGLQIRNTISTDLSYRWDETEQKLYINAARDTPSLITIEYVPQVVTAEDVKGNYWIDIVQRLSSAYVKKAVGMIRTKYRQANTQIDIATSGQQLIEEANNEINTLRDRLNLNQQLSVSVD